MPTTLMSLPKEIREKILQQAFSIDNNTSFRKIDDESWTSPSQMDWKPLALFSLFELKHQLSAEAVECFHRENTLISLGIHTNTEPFLETSYLTAWIMTVIPTMRLTKHTRDAAMRIDIYRDTCRQNWKALDQNDESEFFLMTSRHLFLLVGVLNAASSDLAFNHSFSRAPSDIDSRISLDFNTESRYYKPSRIRTSQMMNGLKGIRCHKSEREFHIQGLDDNQRAEFLKASNLPRLSSKESFMEARRLRDHGLALAALGYHVAARSQYILATLTMLAATMEPGFLGSSCFELEVFPLVLSTLAGCVEGSIDLGIVVEVNPGPLMTTALTPLGKEVAPGPDQYWFSRFQYRQAIEELKEVLNEQGQDEDLWKVAWIVELEFLAARTPTDEHRNLSKAKRVTMVIEALRAIEV